MVGTSGGGFCHGYFLQGCGFGFTGKGGEVTGSSFSSGISFRLRIEKYVLSIAFKNIAFFSSAPLIFFGQSAPKMGQILSIIILMHCIPLVYVSKVENSKFYYLI